MEWDRGWCDGLALFLRKKGLKGCFGQEDGDSPCGSVLVQTVCCVWGREGCLHGKEVIFGLCNTGKHVACSAEASSGRDGILGCVVCLRSIPQDAKLDIFTGIGWKRALASL